MKRDKKRTIYLVVLAVYMIFIYSNSLIPAVGSSRQSSRVLLMIAGLLKNLGLEYGWLTEHIVRKTAHFLEYGVMGFLVYHSFWDREKKVEALKTSVFVSFLAPFIDETIQLFVEGRSGQISDVWLDLSGAAVGFAAAALFCLLWKKLRRPKTGWQGPARQRTGRLRRRW